MGRKKSHLLTLIKFGPLYLLAGWIIYLVFFVEKDLDYLGKGYESYTAGQYSEALHYLDMAADKKVYLGADLLDLYLLRAQVLFAMNSPLRAIDDLNRIIQLSPASKRTCNARSLMGEIYDSMKEFDKALDAFEMLQSESLEQDEEIRFSYQSKTAAAAHNLSNALLKEARTILNRSLRDFDRELKGLTLFITDLHNDYDLAYVENLLEASVSSITKDRIIHLASEAKHYYRYAHGLLEEYPQKPFFNPLASIFLTNILYRSNRFFPALLECSMALKEPLKSKQQSQLQQIMANIYWDVESYGKAAEVFETIREASRGRPAPSGLFRNITLTHLQNKKYSVVIREAEDFRKKRIMDHVVNYCLGTAYLMTDQVPKAINLLSNVAMVIQNNQAPPYLIESPARKDTLVRLFEAYKRSGSINQARNTLDYAVQIFPTDLDLRRARADFFSEVLNKPDIAAADYFYLLKHGPRDPMLFEQWIQATEFEYRSMTGVTFAARAQQLVNFYQSKERIIGADKKRFSELTLSASFPEAQNIPGLRLALSEEFLRLGRREEGKSLLRTMIRSLPDVLELRYRLGELYLIEGKTEPAIREFETILKRDPDDFHSVKMAILCYRDLNNFVGEGELIQSLLHRPESMLGSWMLARLKYEKANYKGFIEIYDSFAGSSDFVQADLDLLASQCLIELVRFDEASELIAAFLPEDPEYIEALKAKVGLLLATGEKGPLIDPSEEEQETEAPPDSAPAEMNPEAPVAVESESTEADEVQAEATTEGEAAPVAKEATPDEDGLPTDDPLLKTEEELKPLSEIELLIDEIRSHGKSLYHFDLEELIHLLLKMERPDLALRLMLDIETMFPIPMSIHRMFSEAYRMLGDDVRAAEYLLSSEASTENLRKVFAMSLSSDHPEEMIWHFIDYTIGIQIDKEFLLSAATGAMLNGFVTEADRNLHLARKVEDTGRFTQHEAEFIDFLIRVLKQYSLLGMDINPAEPETEEEGSEQEETDTKGTDEADSEEVTEEPASNRSEPGEAPPASKTSEETEENKEEASKNPDQESTPEIEPDTGVVQPEEVQTDPQEEGAEAVSGEDEMQTEAVDDPTAQEEEPEDQSVAIDEIVLDGLTLQQRYIRITAEAGFLIEVWQAEPDKAIRMARSMLLHLVLRRLPEYEQECLEEALKVLEMEPACGLAARYILDNDPRGSTPIRTVTLLSPVTTTQPDDVESLSLIAPAYAHQGLAELSDACLKQVEILTGDTLWPRLLDAKIKWASGNLNQAFLLCRNILDNGPQDIQILKSLLSILVDLGEAPEMLEVVTHLTEQDQMAREDINQVISFLEQSALSFREQELAEKLLDTATSKQRLSVITLLAKIYRNENADPSLVELSHELIAAMHREDQDYDAIYWAFKAVGTALTELENHEQALFQVFAAS